MSVALWMADISALHDFTIPSLIYDRGQIIEAQIIAYMCVSYSFGCTIIVLKVSSSL